MCCRSELRPTDSIDSRPLLAAPFATAREQLVASHRWSTHIASAVEHAVHRLDPLPGECVLDVVQGTGRMAHRVGARGSRVAAVGGDEASIAVACDPNLDRAIEFRLADLEDFPFADGFFDGVISTFGVIYARQPERTARELARVCRLGGRLALTSWTPSSTMRELFELMGRYAPRVGPLRGPDFLAPISWGKTHRVVELLGDSFDLGFEVASSYYRAQDGVAAFEDYARGFPPMRALLGLLDVEAAASFRREFETLHECHRTGLGVLVPREYLVTIGRRRD